MFFSRCKKPRVGGSNKLILKTLGSTRDLCAPMPTLLSYAFVLVIRRDECRSSTLSLLFPTGFLPSAPCFRLPDMRPGTADLMMLSNSWYSVVIWTDLGSELENWKRCSRFESCFEDPG
jgi:hypothetical protein